MALSLIPATNCWTQAERNVAAILLACPTLLDFLGVADANAAQNGNMYYDSVGSAEEEYDNADWINLFPQVIIGTPGDEGSAFEISEPATQTATGKGVIELQFAAMIKLYDYDSSWHKPWLDKIYVGNPFTNLNPPSEADLEQSFKNAVGNILEEAAKQHKLAPNTWTVREYGRQAPNQRADVGDLQTCDVLVASGIEPGGES